MLVRTHNEETLVSEAAFSDCETYRYYLRRTWDRSLSRVCFVLCNPSTATEIVNDPTITRCIGFAKAWDCGGIDIVNIFALRSTDPAALYKARDPIGEHNDEAIKEAVARCRITMVAWSNHGKLDARGCRVAKMIAPLSNTIWCFGLTGSNYPKHPLYLKSDSKPQALCSTCLAKGILALHEKC